MNLKNIFNRRNRVLLAELVRTDFKLRYQESALGYLWSILSPLLLFAILYVVFDKFLGLGRNVEHFPVYLLSGIVLWRFFTEATNNGLKVIVNRGSLIRKINFPKYIIVISGTVSSLINLALNLVIVLVFCVLNGVNFSWGALWIFPLIIELYVLALAVAFLLATVNVKLRDIGYLWDVFLQAAFYATPIIYPLSYISDKSILAAKIVLLNPAAQIIQDFRKVLITDTATNMIDLTTSLAWLAIPFIIIITVGLAGFMYFKANQGRFAEEI